MSDGETRKAIKWAEGLCATLHRNSVSVNSSAIKHLEELTRCAKLSIMADKIIDEMADKLSKEVG